MRSFRGPILGERTDWGGGSGNGRNGRSSAPPDGDRGTGDNTDNGERGERRGGQLYQRPRAAPLFTPEQLRQAMALHGQVPKVFTPRSVSAQQPRLSTLFPDHDIEDEDDDDPVDDTDDNHDQVHRRRGRTKDKNSRNHTGTTSTPETPKPDERLLLGARAAAAGIPRDTPTRTQSACSPRDRHNQHFGPLTGINKPLPALPPPSTNDLFLVSGQQVKQLQQLQQLQNYQPQKQQHQHHHHHHLQQLPQSPQPAHLARAHSPDTAAIIPRPLNIVKKKPSFAPSTATSTTGSSTPNWATPPTTPVPVPKPLVWRQHSSGQQQRTPSQRSQESQFSNGSGSGSGSGGLVGPLVGSGLGSSDLSGSLRSSSNKNTFGPSGPPPSHPPPAVPPLHHHQFGPLGRWSASSSLSSDEEANADTDIEYAAVSTEFGGRARNDSTNTLDRIEAELASWAGLQENQTQKQKAKAVVGPPREERDELQALPSFASSSTGWDDKGKDKGKAKKDDKEKEKDKDKKWWGRGRKDKKEKQKGKEKAEQEQEQELELELEDDKKKRREEEAAHSQVVELDEAAYEAEDDWEDDE